MLRPWGDATGRADERCVTTGCSAQYVVLRSA
ncbi:hypothetical protein Ae263Ps1_1219c [Pseudonocardia sp. Ae263_Ps1]|nr:hypothetical protein Ae263Ps1_1219c [Pseudonocardia sp. Ae263_Ps1]